MERVVNVAETGSCLILEVKKKKKKKKKKIYFT
jgi:hypothetical protein